MEIETFISLNQMQAAYSWYGHKNIQTYTPTWSCKSLEAQKLTNYADFQAHSH